MEKIEIVKTVRKRAGASGFPLSVMLDLVNINRTAYNSWLMGLYSPTQLNYERLEDLLHILDTIEKVKNKRCKNA